MRAVVFNACENIEQFAVALERIIGAVAGKIWNVKFVRQTEQRLVDVFLVRQMMPLQLDIQTPFKNMIEPSNSLLPAMCFYLLVQKTIGAARDAKQILRVVFYVLRAWQNVHLFCDGI